MRTPPRELALPAAVALAGALVLAALGLQTMAFTDYEVEAEPSLLALRHGHPLAFFAHLPAYGGSLILRAPFALLPGAWHGGDLALFRSMAVPCLLASVTLALLLYRRARELGAGAPAAWMALGLVAVNPLTLRALDIGHPEELLGGALCVAAGLAATGRRPLLTGVLLGVAVANKPWALLAVVPVALMLPEQRRLALATTGAVAAAICAPMLVLGAPVTTDTVAVARTSGAIFQPWQLWWFLGEHGHRVMGLTGEKVGYRTPPAWVSTVNHPLVVLVPIACALFVARRRGTLRAADGFALLALCFQLRCLLDTWNNVYYALPACLALVAWEVHAGRLPLVAFATTGMTWITFELLPEVASPDMQAAAYLAFTVPLVGALALVSAQATTWSSFGSPETTSAPSSVTITRSSIRTPTAPGT
jgi:hypothetical protein